LDSERPTILKKKRVKRMTPGKMDVIETYMDNPHFTRDHVESQTNPRRIKVQKNARESAVEMLFARKLLNEAQKQTADRFRSAWERCGGAGSAALDYTREVVDGGGAREAISERQIDAGRELVRCRQILGARIYDLICKVCGQGLSLQQLAPSNRDRLTAADNLRNGLDDLAEMWGIIRRPKVNG
jgi:hypothetical protein